MVLGMRCNATLFSTITAANAPLARHIAGEPTEAKVVHVMPPSLIACGADTSSVTSHAFYFCCPYKVVQDAGVKAGADLVTQKENWRQALMDVHNLAAMRDMMLSCARTVAITCLDNGVPTEPVLEVLEMPPFLAAMVMAFHLNGAVNVDKAHGLFDNLHLDNDGGLMADAYANFLPALHGLLDADVLAKFIQDLREYAHSPAVTLARANTTEKHRVIVMVDRVYAGKKAELVAALATIPLGAVYAWRPVTMSRGDVVVLPARGTFVRFKTHVSGAKVEAISAKKAAVKAEAAQEAARAKTQRAAAVLAAAEAREAATATEGDTEDKNAARAKTSRARTALLAANAQEAALLAEAPAPAMAPPKEAALLTVQLLDVAPAPASGASGDGESAVDDAISSFRACSLTHWCLDDEQLFPTPLIEAAVLQMRPHGMEVDDRGVRLRVVDFDDMTRRALSGTLVVEYEGDALADAVTLSKEAKEGTKPKTNKVKTKVKAKTETKDDAPKHSAPKHTAPKHTAPDSQEAKEVTKKHHTTATPIAASAGAGAVDEPTVPLKPKKIKPVVATPCEVAAPRKVAALCEDKTLFPSDGKAPILPKKTPAVASKVEVAMPCTTAAATGKSREKHTVAVSSEDKDKDKDKDKGKGKGKDKSRGDKDDTKDRSKRRRTDESFPTFATSTDTSLLKMLTAGVAVSEGESAANEADVMDALQFKYLPTHFEQVVQLPPVAAFTPAFALARPLLQMDGLAAPTEVLALDARCLLMSSMHAVHALVHALHVTWLRRMVFTLGNDGALRACISLPVMQYTSPARDRIAVTFRFALPLLLTLPAGTTPALDGKTADLDPNVTYNDDIDWTDAAVRGDTAGLLAAIRVLWHERPDVVTVVSPVAAPAPVPVPAHDSVAPAPAPVDTVDTPEPIDVLVHVPSRLTWEWSIPAFDAMVYAMRTAMAADAVRMGKPKVTKSRVQMDIAGFKTRIQAPADSLSFLADGMERVEIRGRKAAEVAKAALALIPTTKAPDSDCMMAESMAHKMGHEMNHEMAT